MDIPARKYGAEKRYGFNGKENDDETKTQDYGMRIYNQKIGKFLSVDPLTGSYPELTPYQFASNRPIDGIDLDGLEFHPTITSALNLGESAKLLQKAQKGDKRAIIGYASVMNATFTLGFLQLQIPATVMTFGNSAAFASFRHLVKETLWGAGAGLAVNVAFSLAKGEEGYELQKAAISGLLGGAVLGAFGNVKSLQELYTVGFTSGTVTEFTNQTFDNLFGGGDGSYDLETVLTTGAIGGFTNIIASKVTEFLNLKISENTAKKLKEADSKPYRDNIRKETLKAHPRIGTQQLKKAVNMQIKMIKGFIKQQDALDKILLKFSIDRSMDLFQDKSVDELKKEKMKNTG